MQVIAWKALRSFAERYPDTEAPLRAWFKLVERSEFASFAELRQIFPTVDKIGDLHVFNIGGNKYRLITYIRFDWRRCYVKHVLTHTEYDKGAWKK